jgi:hypothetical protein
MESARLDDPEAGPKGFLRLRAAAVNESLRRHLAGLDYAMAQNELLLQDVNRLTETRAHLRALRAEAAAAVRRLDEAAPATQWPPSPGPSP